MVLKPLLSRLSPLLVIFTMPLFLALPPPPPPPRGGGGGAGGGGKSLSYPLSRPEEPPQPLLDGQGRSRRHVRRRILQHRRGDAARVLIHPDVHAGHRR